MLQSMERFFTSLMQNPYAWLVLSLCTMLSVPIAFVLYIKGKKRLEISYYKTTYEIVKAGKSIIPEFQLMYKDKGIDNLYITRFAIWNSGTETIKDSDLIKTKPLAILCNSTNAEILDAVVIKETDETNRFIVMEKDSTSVKMWLDYLEKHDGIVIQVLHTGGDSNFVFECKIKGGKAPKHFNKSKMENSKNRRMNKKKLIAIVEIIECITLLSLCVTRILMLCNIIPSDTFYKWLLEQELKNTFEELTPYNIASELVLMPLLMIFVATSTWDTIKWAFRVGMPGALKQHISYDDLI